MNYLYLKLIFYKYNANSSVMKFMHFLWSINDKNYQGYFHHQRNKALITGNRKSRQILHRYMHFQLI